MASAVRQPRTCPRADSPCGPQIGYENQISSEESMFASIRPAPLLSRTTVTGQGVSRLRAGPNKSRPERVYPLVSKVSGRVPGAIWYPLTIVGGHGLHPDSAAPGGRYLLLRIL